MQIRKLWIVIPIVIIFALAVWGTYLLYQKRVVEPQRSEEPALPSPATEGFSLPSPVAQEITTAPNSQPATGVTSLPETGGR
ncbi:hypothetical protein A2697_04065 [Candidatus Curtissbacteria bacterium RIFCSPHIGHO2_01_FULL_41_44]|uniref:Cytochrome oxidase subunit II transmembrane region profile domain-containing protein n=1 Tax=Candidatus Curtissbacteria bacterium RIFCSPLOWO2_01_FULL_42_50 TaxID=1797730 RepID=A0A1F5H3B3_9BACT|nr:MAG: hypothetical protein A2697_04065 [Candidatus Curtissbacteria bacterium RIFCSPHIGHO2_01_FULL_41_44]OGD92896.1 MAG: hypothetical protein A3C33_02195 [Candidatus Curtissbacteria bacterium RIFCSPHIGHO2_02_FULL_42_58]OGD96629.1 MAG: hypothetical protein A3E71_00690 [Candidatus Curtissbacteria bacterium RIFCSPHIGHO2_12_FULL_42_33]OGD98527.1 MAG: hypothetical protein A3B54_00300 [Candidatus Curtissbacteria bacterium RIFCSPLOWO2_01_FULL_42_50]OGE02877.1 MAG: hypothetical protein A3G16_04280 [Ca